MNKIYYFDTSTPIGSFRIVSCCDFIIASFFLDSVNSNFLMELHPIRREMELLLKASLELKEWFSGNRENFSIPLSLKGTFFQKKVWLSLLKIPFGATASYSDIAKEIGYPYSYRAVGSTIGRNPIAIFIPCHRVIRSDNSISGFAHGVWRKKMLLKHEKNKIFSLN